MVRRCSLAMMLLVIFVCSTSLAFATTYNFTGEFVLNPLLATPPPLFSGSVTFTDGTGSMNVDYSLLGRSYTWTGPIIVTSDGSKTIFSGNVGEPMELILVNALGGLNPGDVLNTQWPNGTGIGGSLTSLEPSPVPLPPSLVLLFSGLMAMVAWRFRKTSVG